MESFPDEDVMKTVKMTAKDLEYYTNLVDKAVSGFGRIDLRFDRDSTVGKMLSSREKLSMKGGVNQCSKLLSYFKNESHQPSATHTLISQQLSTMSQDSPPGNRLTTY